MISLLFAELACQYSNIQFKPVVFTIDIDLSCKYDVIDFILTIDTQQLQFQQSVIQIVDINFDFQVVKHVVPIILSIRTVDEIFHQQIDNFTVHYDNPIACLPGLFIFQSQIYKWIAIYANLTVCQYNFKTFNIYIKLNQSETHLEFNSIKSYTTQVDDVTVFYPIFYKKCDDDVICNQIIENIYQFVPLAVFDVGLVNLSVTEIPIFQKGFDFDLNDVMTNESINGDVDFSLGWNYLYVSADKILNFMTQQDNIQYCTINILLKSLYHKKQMTLTQKYNNISELFQPFHAFHCDKECQSFLLDPLMLFQPQIIYEYFRDEERISHYLFYMRFISHGIIRGIINTKDVTIQNFTMVQNISLLFGDSIIINLISQSQKYIPQTIEDKKKLQTYPKLLQKYNGVVIIIQLDNTTYFSNNLQTYYVSQLIVILFSSILVVIAALVIFLFVKLK